MLVFNHHRIDLNTRLVLIKVKRLFLLLTRQHAACIYE